MIAAYSSAEKVADCVEKSGKAPWDKVNGIDPSRWMRLDGESWVPWNADSVAAVAAEREACAQIADEFAAQTASCASVSDDAAHEAAKSLAVEIRARDAK